MKLYDVLRKEKDTGKALAEREDEFDNEEYDERRIPHEPRAVFTKKRLIIIGGIVLALVFVYILGLKLLHATVTVTERRIPFTLNKATIELTNQEKTDSGRLSFQAMVVTTTITREVYGSAITTSNTKATGTVVFFNEYSTAKQTVKKGTTLTATNGKKYITQAAATVPGYTTVNKKKVPGTSPSIQVTAADVGETYNSTGTTLTVSGWANASKTFYARSAAITGGEAGIAHTMTDSEKQDAITTLQAQLIERLKRETRAQIPEGLVTFPELQLPIIDQKTFTFRGGSVRFPATMTGTMVSYLIPRTKLEQAIAAKALREKAYPTVAVPDLEDLVFDMQTAIPTDPSVVPDSITVLVSGSGTVIAKVPIDKVKEQLLGQRRRTFATALKDIPEIDTARFNIFPFWSPRFPSEWTKIDVVTR
jgi:hypothetical protein